MDDPQRRSSHPLLSPRGCVLLLVLLGLVAFMVFFDPGRPTTHRYSPGADAIGQLKTIGTSQALFREGDKDGDGTLDYGTLTELGQQKLIDAVLASGTKRGYRFDARPGSAAPEFVWWATATPTAELKGQHARSFFANHEGVIWYTDTGAPAPITSSAAPPPGLEGRRQVAPVGRRLARA